MSKKYAYIEVFKNDDKRLMTTIKDALFPKLKDVKIARKFVLQKLLDDAEEALR